VQRSSRAAQFQPFSPLHALALLAKDFGAALFGGLPLYAGRAAPGVVAALALLLLACLAAVIQRNHKHSPLFALPATATPCGLLALGLVFHNTPIEIRYLAFSMPFLALLFAASLPRGLLAAMIGLGFAPGTMQAQALAARQAGAMVPPGGLILLPFGNDGVGVPGPFLAAAPARARVELLRPGQVPALAGAPEVILAMLGADAASRAATEQAKAWLRAQPCLTQGPATKLTEAFINRCAKQQR
jgi:hypothetical protein